MIFNLLMVVAALALFVVLMKRVVKRIKSLECQIDLLFKQCKNLADVYNKLNKQLDDVRKSLDNF